MFMGQGWICKSYRRLWETMNVTIPLCAHNRLIQSPFGLLGTNENALTFALAYTFQQSPELLKWFLRKIGILGIRQSLFLNARIDLQCRSSGEFSQGITDIEIRLPGYFHVIVEAKVGLGVPSIDQCRKYLPRFTKTQDPVQKLVAVVQSPDNSFIVSYGRQDVDLSRCLVGFNWSELLPECVRLILSTNTLTESKPWLRAFYSFLNQEFSMKAFTTEAWILPINTEPLWANGLSFWDIHQKYRIYFDSTYPTVRPLYLAFRVNGILDSIYRVDRIEHSIAMIDRVPELANLPAEWPKLPHTIWHFGDQVKLANPLRTGGGMYNRHVRCDLDLLLTCKTVSEIQVEMKKRNSLQKA